MLCDRQPADPSCSREERVFLEDPAVVGFATLSAVRYAYEQLGDDVCEHCPQRGGEQPDNGALYYVI